MKKLTILVLAMLSAVIVLSSCGHTHAYGEWETETEASCSAEGVKVRKCSCGEKETETIAKLPHTEGEYVETQAPTCQEDGIRAKLCAKCDEVLESEVIPKANKYHDYVLEKTITVTCTSDGYELHKCSVCNKSTSKNRITATGHDVDEFTSYNYDATLTEDGTKNGYCNTCKKDVKVTAEGSSAVLRAAFSGKNISVLGDSISTYIGVSNDTSANSTIGNNEVYYTFDKLSTLKVSREETWWQQAIDGLGASLLVNNSFSGSCVLRTGRSQAAYINRAVQLHDDAGENAGTKPDIIFIYLGTNDFSDYYAGTIALGDASTLNYEAIDVQTTATNFAEAYAIMLDKMTEAYPDAEIYCLNVLEKQNDYNKSKLDEFNAVIEAVSEHYGAHLVDIRKESGIKNDPNYLLYVPQNDGDGSVNNVHPNNVGMDLITDCVLEAVYKNSKYYPEITLN